jgi:anti-sigma regulatory factor (Ser/Thr protein kinase)
VPFERDFPAVAASLSAIRTAVDDYAQEAGAPPRLALRAVHAVHEAAANAVIHGYRGGDDGQCVAIRGVNGDGWLRFTVTDRGDGFRPSRTSPGYGLGLAIMAQLADEFEIRDRDGGGLVVVIAFRLAG